jgi:hypothetical protein
VAARLDLVSDKPPLYSHIVNTGTLKNILIPISVTLALLLVVEWVSHSILTWVYNRKFDSNLIQEQKYSTTSGLKPDTAGMVWGKAFHTDEMGGRIHQKKKSGKQKLLMIGDSVTEGVGVDDSTTFADRYNSGHEQDIRNISLIGWSVSDYRNAIEQLLSQDSLIKDICLFYCLNDIYGKTNGSKLPPMADKGIWSQINALLQDRCATYKLIKLWVYENSDHYYRYDAALYHDTTKVNAMMADMVYIRNICQRSNVGLKVFILPYRSQLKDRSNNFPQRVLTGLFTKNNIRFEDLLKTWPQCPAYNEFYLFADEIHLSEKGHGLLSQKISLK